MSNLKFTIENFNPKINEAMEKSFRGHSKADLFNEVSKYLVLYHEDNLAALGRITNCPNGVFYTWSNGSPSFNNTSNAVDLGRCLVTPEFKGSFYYDLLLQYCFRWASGQGYTYVNGSSIVGRKMVERLKILGMTPVGMPVELNEYNGFCPLVQPFVCYLADSSATRDALFMQTVNELESKGFTIHQDSLAMV